MSVSKRKECLVGVDKTLNNHFARTSDMVCSKCVQIETVNSNTMQRNLEVTFCDLKLENYQSVEFCSKKWRSQFVSSKYQKSLWSHFATLETRADDHFRDLTKMI